MSVDSMIVDQAQWKRQAKIDKSFCFESKCILMSLSDLMCIYIYIYILFYIYICIYSNQVSTVCRLHVVYIWYSMHIKFVATKTLYTKGIEVVSCQVRMQLVWRTSKYQHYASTVNVGCETVTFQCLVTSSTKGSMLKVQIDHSIFCRWNAESTLPQNRLSKNPSKTDNLNSFWIL